ncbi:amidase [Leucobacter sp. CSA1]|uniref:Amidase n=1 Tax=Leucobacter chromiisoli TaxID=2796471 RepID=A0A934Q802_9MICO|nr:amidase family protein [Leucobacter chromiisoli]MBK0418786.1 amidase [Leucobacter chromiisoli]
MREQPGEAPLIWWSAEDLRDAIAEGTLTAEEVMSAFLDRIDTVNDEINVLVFQLPREECLELAREADRRRETGEALGPLHGLPIAVKDLVDVRGMPTSQGSRAFANGSPVAADAPHVGLMREAGALIIGKTNSPEFGVGTLTWNDVFGITRNPYDTSRHAGGSSGGVAAVAAGMLPLCDGSDSGGSLRYPAAFCNAVGLRTTPGTVPGTFGGNSWDPHSVYGPMARSCSDAALLLDAMRGAHPAAPLSRLGEAHGAEGEERGRAIRLAWSDDLGGLPVSAEVRETLADARRRLVEAGVQIVDVNVDLDGVDRAWEIIELFGWYSLLGADPLERPELYRDDFLRNVSEAADFTSDDLATAFARRYRLYTQFAALLEDFDGFVCPATPVVAPPAEVLWVDEVDGVEFSRYFEWQRLACRLTMTGHPVLAMPAGFSGGLPVGMQVVGSYGGDRELLALGSALEEVLGMGRVLPQL